jgi:hypothetical protein
MNHHFDDSSQEVFACFSCPNPKNFFSKFDVEKLCCLAEIYSAVFSYGDCAMGLLECFDYTFDYYQASY